MKSKNDKKKEINSILSKYLNAKSGALEKKDTSTLSQVLLEFKHESELSELVSALFTKQELRMFVNRLLIVKMLRESMVHHQIAGKLKVGIATVSRGASEVIRGKFDFM